MTCMRMVRIGFLDTHFTTIRRNQIQVRVTSTTHQRLGLFSEQVILHCAHFITMANQGIRYFSTRGGDDTLTFEEVRSLKTEGRTS